MIPVNINSIPIESVNPAPYNPRKDLQPKDREYQKLKRSIEEFGIVEPVVWNGRTGNLVGGHQRFKVLKELGHKDVLAVVVDLDDKKEKALNIALNKISGEWDFPKLKELLVDLDDGSFDLSLTGFDELELKDLIDFDGKEGLTGDDDVPEKPEAGEVKTKRGDVYHLGGHRLMCGDSLVSDDLDTLMVGRQADLVFTDPPYNVDYEGYTEEKLKIKNDKMSPEQFESFLRDVFASYRLCVKDGASLYVCHPDWFQREFQNALEMAGFAIRTTIVWAKNTFGWGFSRYKFQHEGILYAYVKGEVDQWYGDKSQSTLWEENKPSANRLHPTMKPVELVTRALLNSSKAGDLVLDLFGGSGSTMIAAEKTNRSAMLMELDPAYCDVIVTRWEKFTGKTAQRLGQPVPA